MIVHGGGPQIGQAIEKLGRKSEFIEGMRVTDSETMQVVEQVLGGSVNKEIVDLITQHGGTAAGLMGKDNSIVQAKRLTIKRNSANTSVPEEVDLGHVGEVSHVDPAALKN